MFYYLNFQNDVFAFGVIMCELLARIDPDPSYMIRYENFAVNQDCMITKVLQLDPECPVQPLLLAFECAQVSKYCSYPNPSLPQPILFFTIGLVLV